MEPEIRPTPTDAERSAILSALARDEGREPPAYRSRWREAALEESLGPDPEAESGGSQLPE